MDNGRARILNDSDQDENAENYNSSPDSSFRNESNQSSMCELQETLHSESDHIDLHTSESSEIIEFPSSSENENQNDNDNRNSTNEDVVNDHLRPDEYVNVEHLDEDVHIDADVNFDEELINDRGPIYDDDATVTDDGSSDEEYDPVSDEEANNGPIENPLLKLLRKEAANETLTANVVVNEIEMLMGIIKLADVYSLSNSFIADICGLFNSFFDVPVLPNSRYKLDRLFYNDESITYHAVCPECKNYVSEFRQSDRQVQCDVCEARIDLKDPSYNEFFVIFDVRDEIKNLIEENREFYESIVNNRHPYGNLWTDFYDGQKYDQFRYKLPEIERNSYATLTFNSDGSPVWKSSKFSIWPAQIQLNELPPLVKCNNTITMGLWFGHDKPQMNIFLTPLSDTLNNLSEIGIQYNSGDEVKNVKVYTLCCCVDSVARAPMQGIIQFNGYYGCSWCLHPGESVRHNTGSAIKYTLQDRVPEERREEETLHHIQEAVNTDVAVYGMKRATPLLTLKHFDIIRGFVPDSMHCVFLGVAKQFFDYWFSSTQKEYSISKANMDKADKFVKGFKVPTQLARLSRSIKDRKYWKSKEWENWLLFYSLPVLQEISNFSRYRKHWELLVESIHLLMKNSISRDELLNADYSLKKFYCETENLYSKDAMSYNVHQLTHLPQSIADWGPLWAHTGYPFENGNGEIIKKVHAARGVISQVSRSICRNKSLRILEDHLNGKNSPVVEFANGLRKTYTKKCIEIGDNKYFGKPKPVLHILIDNPNIIPDRCKAYNRLMIRNCIFKSSMKNLVRSDNSYARTENGEYIQCVQFIVVDESNDEYTIHKKIRVENFSSTCRSIKRIVHIDEDLNVIETNKIEKLCVFMVVDKIQYISSIPNMYWYN